MSRHSPFFQRLLRRWLSPVALLGLRIRCKFGTALSIRGDQQCTVLIASYLRPKNIQTIINAVVKCRFVSEIVISNHNPEIVMSDFIECDDARVRILNSEKREYCGYRFKVASDLDGEYFLILDDDIFMSPEQVRKLFVHLLKDPDVPHGFHGSRYKSHSEEDEIDEVQHVARRETNVDVLHQAYAVTKSQISHMLQIAEAANRSGLFPDENPANFADDMMISVSGEGQPRVHDLAPILICQTSLQQDIAVCGRVDFQRMRSRAFSYLRENVGVSGERRK